MCKTIGCIKKRLKSLKHCLKILFLNYYSTFFQKPNVQKGTENTAEFIPLRFRAFNKKI